MHRFVTEKALEVAKDAASKAGAEIRTAHQERNGAGMTVIVKSGIDLVTETDRKCEDIILGLLRAAFPEHCFVGEESTFATGEEELVRVDFDAP